MNINARLKANTVSSFRGAPMGRADWGLAEGIEARVFVRAKDRDAAKLKVNEHFLNAKFFR